MTTYFTRASFDQANILMLEQLIRSDVICFHLGTLW